MKLALLFSLMACATLSVGCGKGLYGLCKTSCDSTDEYRDMECVCRKAGGGTVIPRGPEEGPFMDFKWGDKGPCGTTNREYWMGNRNPKRAYWVKYSYVTDYPDRTRVWSDPILLQPATSTIETGYVIGAEDAQGSQGCYDKDFQLEEAWPDGSRNFLRHRLEVKLDRMGIARSEGWDSLTDMELASTAVSKRKLPTARMVSRQILNCQAECKAATANCLRVAPADQAKLIQLKNTLDSMPVNGGTIGSSALLSIFNLASDACARSDTRISSGGRSLNRGEPCFYSLSDGGAGANTLMALHISGLAKATASRNGDTTSLLFSGEAMRPELIFASRAFDADYGGSIATIEADPTAIYISTDIGACVAAQTK